MDEYEDFLNGGDPEEKPEEKTETEEKTEKEETEKPEGLAFFEINHDKEKDTYTMSAETFNKLMNRFLA